MGVERQGLREASEEPACMTGYKAGMQNTRDIARIVIPTPFTAMLELRMYSVTDMEIENGQTAHRLIRQILGVN